MHPILVIVLGYVFLSNHPGRWLNYSSVHGLLLCDPSG
jgi:hypothetical protein